jgi:hypothetical protein
MHTLYDDVMVGSALLASSLYALSSLAPRMFRRGLTWSSAVLLRLVPWIPGLDRMALRLASAASAPATGSCGGCANCGPAPGLGDPAAQNFGGAAVQTHERAAGQAADQTVGQTSALPARQKLEQRVGQAAPDEIRIPVSTIGKRRL